MTRDDKAKLKAFIKTERKTLSAAYGRAHHPFAKGYRRALDHFSMAIDGVAAGQIFDPIEERWLKPVDP